MISLRPCSAVCSSLDAGRVAGRPVEVAAERQRQPADAVVGAEVDGVVGLLVEPVVRARHALRRASGTRSRCCAGRCAARRRPDRSGGTSPRARCPASPRRRCSAAATRSAAALAPRHVLERDLAAHEVADPALEHVGADRRRRRQVALDRDVDAGRQLGPQRRVAGAVGLGRRVRAGRRVARVDRPAARSGCRGSASGSCASG